MPEHPPLRVLIVDDEPLGRRRVAGIVRKERGVEIFGMIGDGVSAVEAIRSLALDLVFLDVQMPGMTGLEVVRTIGPADMPFFFQAEDGIRDYKVTGVQTCALPI